VGKAKTPRAKKASTKGASGKSKKSAAASSEPQTRDELIKSLLTKAQGESVQRAKAADHKPVELDVLVSGSVIGTYKGQTPEHFHQAAKFFFDEAKLGLEIEVRKKSSDVVPAAQESVDQSSSASSHDNSDATSAGV
jgi:hypothetical protein